MNTAVCVPATADTVVCTARLVPTPSDMWHVADVSDTQVAVWQLVTPTRLDAVMSCVPKLMPDTVTLKVDVATMLVSSMKLTTGATTSRGGCSTRLTHCNHNPHYRSQQLANKHNCRARDGLHRRS